MGLTHRDFLQKKAFCSRFCSHYKPEKTEEFACRGYEIVRHLVQAGALFSLADAEGGGDRRKAEPLVHAMCSVCAFQEDGCDFMLDRKAAPCGGFLVLAWLIEKGSLTVEDLP